MFAYKYLKKIKAFFTQSFYYQISANHHVYAHINTYRYLLHLLLHSVDCSRRCGESLDGLTGRGKNTLVLNGHRLELR